MAFEPTAAQKAAIELKNKTMLVSAAAGSGKTATLTERILQKITDKDNPCSITELLVVTFTKASAADLLAKLSKKLSERLSAEPGNRHLTDQLLRLRSADISTIHSFCMKVLRPNYQKLGLPSDFRVGDEAEVRMLMQSEMRATLERFYEADPDTLDFPFLTVADCFSDVKNAELLSDSLLTLYDKLISYPESVSLLLRDAESTVSDGEFLDTPHGAVLSEYVRGFADYFIRVFADAEACFAGDEFFSRAYLEPICADLSFLRALRSAATYADLCRLAGEYNPMRVGAVKADNKTPESIFFMEERDEFKKQLKALKERYLSSSPAAIRHAAEANADLCRGLYRILSEFDQNFGAAKRSLGICDYADLERYTYKLLIDENGSPTELAREVGAGYREIYVDEYQDTNEIQDAIFRAISNGNNRFMVGDIKQSIYRFRGANPDIFASYRQKFPVYRGEEVPDGEGVCVFMSENFRCDPTVIEFSNAVSRFLFTASPSVPFTADDELKFAKAGGAGGQSADIYLLDRATSFSDEEDEDVGDGEAELVACEIRRMLDEEVRPNGERYRPSDFAILCRSPNRTADKYRRALGRYGIGADAETGEKFFENPEILLVLCLLHTIDNPLRDTYLAGALCSPVFGFDMDDLARIRRASPDASSLYDALCAYGGEDPTSEKIAAFLSALERYRDYARLESSERLIRYLYEDTGLLSLLSGEERAVSIRRNLLRFYHYARVYESSSYKGLYRFLDYIASMQDEIIQSAESDGGDVVTITSIHKSKGMEFPVCFLSDTARRFNAEAAKSSVVYDEKLGFTAKLRAPGGIARVDTLLRQCALRSTLLEDRREEMRILYVAMTRAKEKLIVTATLPNAKKTAERCFKEAAYANEAWFCKSTRMIEWILGAVGREMPGNTRLFYANTDGELLDRAAPAPKTVTETSAPEAFAPDEEAVTALKSELLSRFAFEYPYRYLESLPAKLTVSRLYPSLLDEATCEETEAPFLREVPDTEELSAYEDLLSPPSFLDSTAHADGADKGTATHIFMQFCDFERLEKLGAKAELSRLVAEKFMPAATAELVRLFHIEKFRCSALFARMRRAKSLRREFRFNVLLPAESFISDAERRARLAGKHVLVQGVIDCLMTEADGSAVLIDYKTDSLTPEEQAEPALAAEKLRARHAPQLTYYALACEKMLGIPVKEVQIYSLPLGDTVSVNPKGGSV